MHQRLRSPVVSCRVLHLPGHGWCWRGVSLTGEILIVPLRRQPWERLTDWLLVDQAMNGPPKRLADRLRRRLWLLRAATLGAPPDDSEPTVQPGARPAWAKPFLFDAAFVRDASQGWCLRLSTSTGPRSYPVRRIEAGKLWRWIEKVDQLHGRPPLAEWLVRWAWVVRNWALLGT